MLDRLTELHDDLNEALAGLAALTETGLPDPSLLAQRRLALSRASAARSRFLELEAYPALLAILSGDEAETVRSLRAEAIARRVESARHIGRWTAESATRDWAEYCEASRAMRAAMRQQIGTEQTRLYPLLRAAELKQAA